MKLFQTTVRFLGHNIHNGTIIPINRSMEFASKFPDEIKDKTQLQRFLDSLNYIHDYYPNLATDAAILYSRLRKNPPIWGPEHTAAVKKIKARVQTLPCLCLPHPEWKKIVETDASDLGFGGILKQFNPNTNKEELLRFHSVDCSVAKQIFKKDVANLAQRQIFATWQATLSVFDFDIDYIKGENNSLPDFLTREYLQKSHAGNPGESSSKSAKDVLLAPETAYIQNTIREETILYIDSSDVQWMISLNGGSFPSWGRFSACRGRARHHVTASEDSAF
ncbi:uncharacterized protein LOC114314226 [Camellia sinensis]|uniref:uncharacterized protein LOC114314226 n=1 Tax=Camellia sinensis TaxID=4442 RepID=UPI001035D5FD|nr:uncharacterized protein LOC114314226 [Camellia sinensis]